MRRAVLAGGVVVALAVALLAGGDAGPDPAATAELERLAAAARARAADPAPGEAWYVRTDVVSSATVALEDGRDVVYRQPAVREVWLADGRAGRLRNRPAGPIAMVSGDRADVPAYLLDEARRTDVMELGADPAAPFGEGFGDPEASARALLFRAREVVGDGGSSTDASVFEAVRSVLLESPLRPAVRANLLRILGVLPGVAVARGRDGVVVAHGGEELELDPADGTVLEVRSVAGGTVTFRATVDVATGVAGVGAAPSRDTPRS